MNSNSHTKEKHFIHRPEYPGGKTALLKYIRENLRYPKDALEQKTEGIVRVWYQVDDNGDVVDANIVKSLSPSCDEEALRLVKSLKYSRPKNMHIRVKSSFHINIHFQLKEAIQQVTYHYSPKPSAPQNGPTKPQEVYTYSIKIQ